MVALAVGGLLLVVLFPYFSGAKQAEKRVKAVVSDGKSPVKQGLRARLMAEDPKDARRKQQRHRRDTVRGGDGAWGLGQGTFKHRMSDERSGGN